MTNAARRFGRHKERRQGVPADTRNAVKAFRETLRGDGF
jgi:hypothetical protein